MAKTSRQVKTDFLAGEISPRAYTRVDTEIYGRACRELTNFIVTPQGGVMYRHGMQYLDDSRSGVEVAPYLLTVSRGGQADDFVLEFGFAGTAGLQDNAVRFVDSGFSEVVATDSETVITCRKHATTTLQATPEVELIPTFVYYVVAQSGEVEILEVDGTPIGTALTGQILTIQWSGGTWSIQNTSGIGVAQSDEWTTSGRAAFAAHPFTAGELPLLQHTQKGRRVAFADGLQPPSYLRFDSDWGDANWFQIPVTGVPTRLFNDDLSPPDSPAITDCDLSPIAQGQAVIMYINGISGIGSGGDPNFFYYLQNNDANNIAGLEFLLRTNPEVNNDEFTVTAQGANVYRLTLIGQSATNNIQALQFDASNFAIMTIIQAANPAELAWSYPTVVEYPAASGNYYQCLQPNVGSQPDTNPTDWELLIGQPTWWDWQYPDGNVWDTDIGYGPGGRGFPRTCTFHDQRLIMGGSDDAPLTIWGSKINDFDDFNGESVDDAEPWEYTLDSLDSPEVQWLTSNRGLAVGSTNGDFLMNAQRTITPTDIFAARYTARRSALNRPVLIGNEIFTIGIGHQEIRRVYYARQNDGYVNEDFSLLAEHLTAKGVTKLERMLVPETVLWGQTLDGDLVGCAYDDFAGAKAFCTVNTDGYIGAYSNAFVLPQDLFVQADVNTGYDNLFIIVRHGTNPWSMELMPHPGYHPEADAQHTVHSDSYQVDRPADGVTPINFISEPRFANQLVEWVGIEADGTVGEGTTQADANGNIAFVISLDPLDYYEFMTVASGLPYTGQIETTEVVQGPIRGTGLGTKRRWNEFTVRCTTPFTPSVKTTETGTYQTPADGTGWATDFEFHDTGFDRGIMWLQFNRPRPLNITGIFGEVSTNET